MGSFINITYLDKLELVYSLGPFMSIVYKDELELEYSTGSFMSIVIWKNSSKNTARVVHEYCSVGRVGVRVQFGNVHR